MKNILKKVFIISITFLFVFLIKLDGIKAACSLSVSAPSSVVVGQTFKVSVTASQNSGSWEYTLSYDSSKVQLVSGSLKVVGVEGDSKTNTYSFKALKSGQATFKPVNASIIDYQSVTECLSGVGSATVTMKTQKEIEESYSRNNNLSSLSVDGAEISPEFNKDVLEYNVTLPVDSTKAKINANAEDSKSSIIGIGEVDVIDGMNKKEITVIAQHGEKKTYILNIKVEELDPIEVKINGKKYTIIRKKQSLPEIPESFIDSTIKINNQDISVYKNEISKIILIGLKDEKGNNELFIYNEKNKSYIEFKNIKGNSSNLVILNSHKKAPFGFKKTKIKVKNAVVHGYENKKYKLVYARNLISGYEGFYLYDQKDQSFQKYDSSYLLLEKNTVLIFMGLILFIILVLLIIIIIKSSKKQKEKNDEPKIKQIDEKEYEVVKKSKKEKLKEIKEAKEKLDKKKPSYKSLFDDEEL